MLCFLSKSLSRRHWCFHVVYLYVEILSRNHNVHFAFKISSPKLYVCLFVCFFFKLRMIRWQESLKLEYKTDIDRVSFRVWLNHDPWWIRNPTLCPLALLWGEYIFETTYMCSIILTMPLTATSNQYFVPSTKMIPCFRNLV